MGAMQQRCYVWGFQPNACVTYTIVPVCLRVSALFLKLVLFLSVVFYFICGFMSLRAKKPPFDKKTALILLLL